MFQKDGGCCSTAKATGLKPCRWTEDNQSLNKITQNRGLTPHSVLYTGVYVKQKKKKPFKSGRPALPGH
jgi:hypothetical protein